VGKLGLRGVVNGGARVVLVLVEAADGDVGAGNGPDVCKGKRGQQKDRMGL